MNIRLTKLENKILDGKIKKVQTVGLWIGIISFIVAIAVIFWTQKIAQKVDNSFHDRYIFIEKDISSNNDLEIKLKESLLNAIKAAKEGWYKYSIEKGRRLSQLFFLIGILLVVNYFVDRIYINLIEKLKKETKSKDNRRITGSDPEN